MDIQIKATLITIGFTLIAGLIGYFYKEYKNRVIPFIALKGITETRKMYQLIDIPDNIMTILNNGSYIPKLDSKDYLHSIKKSYSSSNFLLEGKDDLILKIDNIIQASKSRETDRTIDTLTKIFGLTLFERLVFLYASANKLHKLNVTNTETIIPLFDDDDRIWIGFPTMNESFGDSYFKKFPILKNQTEDILRAIETMDLKEINSWFSSFKNLVKKDIEVAKEVNPLLDDILNKNSRWEFWFYIANLSNSPILIYPKASVNIIDDNNASYEEDCYLVIIEKNKENEYVHKDTKTPLIIPRDSNVEFSMVSNNTQEKMTRGDAFREMYTKETGKFSMKLNIKKNGVFGKEHITINEEVFKDTGLKY